MRHKLPDRFMERLVEEPNSGCWLWLQSLNGGGYGSYYDVRNKRAWMAHRFAYTEQFGPIPRALQIDHLCRTRCCVNPWHLEPVTRSENIRRATRLITHCPQGHPYDEQNTYISPAGIRQCKICRRTYATESYWRHHERRIEDTRKAGRRRRSDPAARAEANKKNREKYARMMAADESAERYRSKKRKYRQREEVKERGRKAALAWYYRNQERVAERKRRQRAARRGGDA